MLTAGRKAYSPEEGNGSPVVGFCIGYDHPHLILPESLLKPLVES
jgi:hypothetical protein